MRLPLWLSAFSLSALAASSQVPQVVVAAKFRAFNQTSATTLAPDGVGFGIQVAFDRLAPPNLTVQLRGPNGTTTALPRDNDGNYGLEREFSGDAAMDGVFPAGTYAIVVNGTAATTFAFSPPVVEPVRVTNFDALQARLGDGPAEIAWPSIPGAVSDDVLGVTVELENGAEVFSTPDNFDPRSTSVSTSPLFMGQTYRANLNYAQVRSVPSSNGTTRVIQASGWAVSFPIVVLQQPLEIIKEPVSRVVSPGQRVDFDVLIQGSGPAAFQWKKDGVAIPGATEYQLTIAAARSTDVGVYTVDIRNPRGVVTSAPAWLLLGPSLSVSLYAGRLDSTGDVDGPADVARLRNPIGMAMDPSGVLYFCDASSHVVRKVTPAGVVSTVAGSVGISGATDAVGAAARFNRPIGLALDPQLNLYVIENGNHTLRKITPAGVVTTIAGLAGQAGARDGVGANARFASPAGLALAPNGMLYVADTANHQIRTVSPAGAVATLAGAALGFVDGPVAAARFFNPTGVAVGRDGTVYVSDQGNSAIRTISPAGIVATLFGSPQDFRRWSGLAVDDDGNVYAADSQGTLARISPSGTPLFLSGGGYYEAIPGGNTVRFSPYGIVRDAQGALYVSDPLAGVITKAVLVPGSTETGLRLIASPAGHSVAVGDAVLLTADATGPVHFYQWRRNGVLIAGATGASLLLRNVTEAMSGEYTFTAGNPVGAVTSAAATVSVQAAGDAGRLANLSIRSRAGAGAQTLIVGLAVAGGGSASGAPLVIRGVGPGLAAFGISDGLTDPVVSVFRGAQAVATNDDWGGAASLRDAFANVGAFALAPASLDSALAMSFAPGGYSVQIAGKGSGSGVALAEVYDVETGPKPAGSIRLVNMSARTQVGAGAELLIAGFVIRGSTSKTLLIRGVGPALARFGVDQLLRNPELKLFRGPTQVGSNDSWRSGDPALFNLFNSVGAFPIETDDAAILITLAPGSYTVQVSGHDQGTGVALVELYEVQ